MSAQRPNTSLRRRRNGFTLIEIVVALGVIGVATGIFVGFLRVSDDLAKKARTSDVAAGLAEQRIAHIELRPDLYEWPALKEGSFAPLETADGELNPKLIGPPATLPTEARAGRAEEDFYRRFSWRAFVSLPNEEAGYIDVVAVIHWEDQGRSRYMTLASCLPRSVAGGDS